MLRVVISNGHFKFILGPAAEEMSKVGILAYFITAGYPTAKVKKCISLFRVGRHKIIKRLLNREEKIPESIVRSLWLSEMVIQISLVVKKITKKTKYSEWLDDLALRIYGHQAAKIINASDAAIYHYRSGYGHNSVRCAKQKGMLIVCDHSIAHPATCDFLVENHGNLPVENVSGAISRFWTGILRDVEQSDHVIVNSEFVKKTFINQGWNPEKIHVVYAGIDDEFLKVVHPREFNLNTSQTLKILFAGDFGLRKGAESLIHALNKINDLPWQLEIVGNIDRGISQRFDSFLSDERVKISGFLPRLQLAECMSKSDIFIFPSLAEGSARVVFMAMACGCYVITTPNSGSIVEDGVHGILVPPGDSEKLEESIRQVLTLDRNTIAQVGKKNAKDIQEGYTQAQYGKNLLKVYERLLASKKSS